MKAKEHGIKGYIYRVKLCPVRYARRLLDFLTTTLLSRIVLYTEKQEEKIHAVTMSGF